MAAIGRRNEAETKLLELQRQQEARMPLGLGLRLGLGWALGSGRLTQQSELGPQLKRLQAE